jgi:hypothetical protein
MSKQVDVVRLLAFFTDRQCNGIVTFINFLASPAAEGLLEVGSGTFDLDGALEDATLTEDERLAALMFKTHSVYIGSRDGSVTPLEWMQQLSVIFDKIDGKRRERLNLGLGQMAAMISYVHKTRGAKEASVS